MGSRRAYYYLLRFNISRINLIGFLSVFQKPGSKRTCIIWHEFSEQLLPHFVHFRLENSLLFC